MFFTIIYWSSDNVQQTLPAEQWSCELLSDTMAEQIKFALSAFELCTYQQNNVQWIYGIQNSRI